MFNPQARWDRGLPADQEGGGEPVQVTASFRKGAVRPLCFTVAGSSVTVARINFSWSERKGRDLVYFFSVSDRRDTYCLCFHAEALSWKLIPLPDP